MDSLHFYRRYDKLLSINDCRQSLIINASMIHLYERITMTYIKHMAFAVKDANAALKTYQDYLGVGQDAEIHDYEGSRNRVAIFNVGDVEYQLCQSMDEGGRFDTWIKDRGYEGLHHICYAVPDIEKALAEAQQQGATLKECVACKVKGSHVHPEGWGGIPRTRSWGNRTGIDASLYTRRTGRI